MLSTIYQISHLFELEHGFQPNILYLNRQHYMNLQEELEAFSDLDSMTRHFGMEIVLCQESPHPNVAWTGINWSEAVSV